MRILTLFDQPGPIPDEALAVCFGRPATPPPGRSLVLENFDEADWQRILALRPPDMPQLRLVVSPAAYPAHKAFIDRGQQYLAFVFAKFVSLTRAANIPDPFGLHQDKPLHLLHEINRTRNAEILLRSPLVDKLAVERLDAPLLLLLPGPSLQDLGPLLKDLARSCLVACITRTLGFCLGHGVEPDFLIQLDTYRRQLHLLPAFESLPRTCLVALSQAPVSGLARRFRGVFFMDSFDGEVLPNPARLRESWLSSLLPCLGLAEVLRAPQVFVAGADLSWTKDRYAGGAAADQTPESFPRDRPVELRESGFQAPDLRGRSVRTQLTYYATAYEAGLFATDIARLTGARFFNLSRAGILDPDLFPPVEPRQALDLPPLDRPALLERLDRALACREEVDLTRFKIKLLKQRQMVVDHLGALRQAQWKGLAAEAAAHPVVASVPHQGDFYALAEADLAPARRLELAVGLLEDWDRALREAQAACQLAQDLRRGARVPLLCLPGEALEPVLARHPGLRLRVCSVWLEITPPPGNDGREWIGYGRFLTWCEGERAVLVTRGAAEEFAELLAAAPGMGWIRA